MAKQYNTPDARARKADPALRVRHRAEHERQADERRENIAEQNRFEQNYRASISQRPANLRRRPMKMRPAQINEKNNRSNGAAHAGNRQRIPVNQLDEQPAKTPKNGSDDEKDDGAASLWHRLLVYFIVIPQESFLNTALCFQVTCHSGRILFRPSTVLDTNKIVPR